MNWKTFDLDYVKAFENINPVKPYETILTGPYRFELDVCSGHRPCWVYFPEGMEYSCRNILTIMPNDMDASTFLETSGWKEIADQEKILLVMGGSSESPWGVEDDNAYMAALDKFLMSRKFLDTKRVYSYLNAYGSGCNPAYRFFLNHPDYYAGAAFSASISLTAEEITAIGTESFLGTDIQRREVPCPVFFLAKQRTDILAYWKEANRTETFFFTHGDIQIYAANGALWSSNVEGQAVSELWLTERNNPVSPAVSKEICTFLTRVVRGPGVLWGCLHTYRTMDQFGFHRLEMEIDGYTRHWYELIPDRTHVLSDGPLPVVIYLHGGSATAASDSYFHEWANVAKERGFILALPTSAMRCFDDMMPHPAWNASRVAHMMDDEKFIRCLVEDICRRLPADKGRVYITGHSMGSAMAQRCAMTMPELFAAVASNSGVVTGGFMGDFDSPGVCDTAPIPVWIQMAEKDHGGGDIQQGTGIPYNERARLTCQYWINRYGCGDVDKPSSYRCGRYLHRQWNTPSGVPMVSYVTVLEKPHCITPQDAWIYYDMFFCRFHKDAEGKLYYMNKPVSDC